MRGQGFDQVITEDLTSSSTTMNCNANVTTETEISEKPTLPSSLSCLNKIIIEKAVSNKTDFQLSESSKSLNDLSSTKSKDNASLDKICTSINIVVGLKKFRSSSSSCIETLLRKENEKFEGEEKFVIENTQVKKTTCPNTPTFYDPDDSTQNIIVVRSDYACRPSPPYERSERVQSFSYPGMSRQPPVYQMPNMVRKIKFIFLRNYSLMNNP